mmetsp:Transcript_13673/g.39959  ORF Transcript_13673/g.39959 Transcript_13673/m.39959 type:complete len:236 (-) Transcript_13673:133-840(-)
MLPPSDIGEWFLSRRSARREFIGVSRRSIVLSRFRNDVVRGRHAAERIPVGRGPHRQSGLARIGIVVSKIGIHSRGDRPRTHRGGIGKGAAGRIERRGVRTQLQERRWQTRRYHVQVSLFLTSVLHRHHPLPGRIGGVGDTGRSSSPYYQRGVPVRRLPSPHRSSGRTPGGPPEIGTDERRTYTLGSSRGIVGGSAGDSGLRRYGGSRSIVGLFDIGRRGAIAQRFGRTDRGGRR